MQPLIMALPGNEALTALLAEKLQLKQGGMISRQFPDGESYVRFEQSVSQREIIFVCTLQAPDNKVLPLYFLAATARDLGAQRVGLISPYLAYMRQDRRFLEGEGITSRYFAKLISGSFDWLVTVDPHLHRYHSLSEIYTIPQRVVHAAPVVAAWIQTHIKNPLLIGPDSESEQWVADVAKLANAPHLVLQKIRHGDHDVEVSVPDVEEWRQHTPILIDDIISTGYTMIATVSHLMRAKIARPICIGVHGIFAGGAYEKLLAAGAQRIVTCNTIAHVSNEIDVTEALVDAVRSVS